MQKQICNFLNRPYPLFLSCRKGCIYYIWLTFILVVLANILQPFGLVNWHEFHKPLVMDFYVILFFGMYALLYMILSYFRPGHYKPDTWTIKKELQALLVCFPATACSTFLFAVFSVPGFEPSLHSFIHLQPHNILLSVVSIPTFAYFVDSRLNPATIARRRKRKEKNASWLTREEQQARRTLQKLHTLMETEQLYLSPKCSLQLVSGHSGIAEHRISAAVNNFTEYTFTDFVNKYRVEHVCRVLQEGKNKRLKLEAVGMECGFGGKVNFYAAFRKFTGKTPGEYLAEL